MINLSWFTFRVIFVKQKRSRIKFTLWLFLFLLMSITNVFFLFFHFVSGQFKERVYGRIHLSFRYISRWDHSSAARSLNVPNYMWSCRKRCAYISKYIYRQDRSENEKQIYHTVGICEMVLFYANWSVVRVLN